VNRSSLIFCLSLVFFPPQFASAQSESNSKLSTGSTIFQALRVGQKVSLKESFGFWEISVLNNGEMGVNTIMEITPTHLLLNDPAQVTKSWIPISAVNRVTVMKIPTAGFQPSRP